MYLGMRMSWKPWLILWWVDMMLYSINSNSIFVINTLRKRRQRGLLLLLCIVTLTRGISHCACVKKHRGHKHAWLCVWLYVFREEYAKIKIKFQDTFWSYLEIKWHHYIIVYPHQMSNIFLIDGLDDKYVRNWGCVRFKVLNELRIIHDKLIEYVSFHIKLFGDAR